MALKEHKDVSNPDADDFSIKIGSWVISKGNINQEDDEKEESTLDNED